MGRPRRAGTRFEGLDVQLQRGVPIAGVEPEVARAVARACHQDWASADIVAYRAKLDPHELLPFVDALTGDGYLEQRVSWPGPAGKTEPEWRTTISGNALAMASFLNPISRAKARSLLNGVLERAAQYNVDPGKPYIVTELRVFGSYVTDSETLGDLDLSMEFTDRDTTRIRTDVFKEYAAASGRRFGTLMAELTWPTKDLLQILRKGSPYINIVTEDISQYTSRWTVVYPRDPEPEQ
jgi:hypothetical protein